jgi:hypothetical protein
MFYAGGFRGEIAAELGRSKSVISRELKRNQDRGLAMEQTPITGDEYWLGLFNASQPLASCPDAITDASFHERVKFEAAFIEQLDSTAEGRSLMQGPGFKHCQESRPNSGS